MRCIQIVLLILFFNCSGCFVQNVYRTFGNPKGFYSQNEDLVFEFLRYDTLDFYIARYVNSQEKNKVEVVDFYLENTAVFYPSFYKTICRWNNINNAEVNGYTFYPLKQPTKTSKMPWNSLPGKFFKWKSYNLRNGVSVKVTKVRATANIYRNNNLSFKPYFFYRKRKKDYSKMKIAEIISVDIDRILEILPINDNKINLIRI